jgi:hypothetical protein
MAAILVAIGIGVALGGEPLFQTVEYLFVVGQVEVI